MSNPHALPRPFQVMVVTNKNQCVLRAGFWAKAMFYAGMFVEENQKKTFIVSSVTWGELGPLKPQPEDLPIPPTDPIRQPTHTHDAKTEDPLGPNMGSATSMGCVSVIALSTTQTGPQFAPTLSQALSMATGRVFVMAGGSLMRTAMTHPCCRGVFCLTLGAVGEILPSLHPLDYGQFSQLGYYRKDPVSPPDGSQDQGVSLVRFKRKKNLEEQQYLNLVCEILESGSLRAERTGMGTKAVFGRKLQFDLSRGFPLLTTKRVFWRAVVAELFWFLSGSTDASVLSEQGIRIWEGHTSRQHLDAVGLSHLQTSDLGKGYGFQWRHFGAEYRGKNANYDGQGVDQVAEVIRLLRTDPYSRRILLTSWNPCDLGEVALPPCHVMCQFFVNEGRLSCQLYQRSGDMGLGVPFNIASYALLTHLLAFVCDLQPGEFHHILGDAHVYLNHETALRQQIERVPFQFPQLRVTADHRDLFGLGPHNLHLSDYVSHPTVKMDMVV